MKGKKGEEKLAKPRLLFVEDDDVTINVIKRILKGIYVVDSTNNGMDALKMGRENNYDGFLIDIGLPGHMNGIQTTNKIKEIKDYKNKSFVAITAYAMPGDQEHFLSNGLTHYISKPFQSQEILDLIAEALNSNKP